MPDQTFRVKGITAHVSDEVETNFLSTDPPKDGEVRVVGQLDGVHAIVTWTGQNTGEERQATVRLS
jgi:hypothetical protein